MIDTGSTCNLISSLGAVGSAFYNALTGKPRLQEARNAVNGYGGNAIQLEGKFKTIMVAI